MRSIYRIEFVFIYGRYISTVAQVIKITDVTLQREINFLCVSLNVY